MSFSVFLKFTKSNPSTNEIEVPSAPALPDEEEEKLEGEISNVENVDA